MQTGPLPTTPKSNELRRQLLTAALVGLPALWLGARAQPAPARRATPSQTEGPFYPVDFPKDSDFDLLRNGNLTYSVGQAVWLEGRVSDLAGRPVGGAVVEIWQCDRAGQYQNIRYHAGDGAGLTTGFRVLAGSLLGLTAVTAFAPSDPWPTAAVRQTFM